MDFDTARLRAFVQVAERGSVAGAAAFLGYSGPGISQQIAKLERQLGAPLFARVGGRLRVSANGERFLPMARTMVELADQAASALDEGGRVTVRVAAFASAIQAFVLPLLDAPAVDGFDVVVRDADDDEALDALRAGDCDLAIVQEYGAFPLARTGGLTYTPVGRDRLRLIGPSTMAPTARLRDLSSVPWLVNGTGTRCEQITERLLSDARVAPAIVGRITDNETLLAMVAAGHGTTIVPELVLAGRRRAITVARLDVKVSRDLLAVTRTGADRTLAPLIAELLAIGNRLAPAGR